jgi:G3E family GTPase
MSERTERANEKPANAEPKTEQKVEQKTEQKVPALVVSGFLGCGKTTLIRHLLDDAVRNGIRVALISNELGELGVDRSLLGQGEEAFVELEGGCVCCELSDDLLDTLQMLWEQVGPDRFIVETSGVALPFDTQLNFWREPVARWMGDDMAIVVVNAEQLAEGRDLEGTFVDQVTSADLLVLNKIDLVSDAQLEEIVQTLSKMEDEAPIVTCVQGRIDPDLLFPPDRVAPDRSGPAPEPTPHTHEHFETEEWQPERGISPEALRAQIEEMHLLRAKGFVETSEGTQLVQVVGRRIELTPVERAPDAAMLGRVVLIRRAE